MDRTEQLPKYCEICLALNKQAPAIVACQNCENELLCESCCAIHRIAKASKSHILLPVDVSENREEYRSLGTDCGSRQDKVQATGVGELDLSSPLCRDREPIQPKADLLQIQPIQGTDSKTFDGDENQQPKCTPGRPEAVDVGFDSLMLVWNYPKLVEGDYFKVHYKKCTPKSTWKKYSKNKFTDNCALLARLKTNSQYMFRVQVVNGDNHGPFSAISEEIKLKRCPAAELATRCKIIDDGTTSPTKMEVPLTEIKDSRNVSCKTRKFELGEASGNNQEKTIMMIGETGTGKSTLIDGIVNYMFGVRWDDKFRFSIIKLDQEERKRTSDQADSQTEWITSYTIHHVTGSRLPYTITIIDTPGFGDTAGIGRDRAIVEQIRGLFTTNPPAGVLTIDAICFMVKAPDQRLTAMQKYIFESIMSLFGKDIKDNICSLITFADGSKPAVLAALQKSNLPFGSYFPFNNSGLFAENTISNPVNLSQIYWQMGMSSFESFFLHLDKYTPQSLQLTGAVLFERFRLDTTLKCLGPQLEAGINQLSVLKQEKELCLKYEHDINACKNHTEMFVVTIPIQVKLEKDTYVTNCIKCRLSCHENCMIPNDDGKRNCWAMDSNGYCRICEGKCYWNEHFNMPYIFKTTTVMEPRTVAHIKKRYEDAQGGKVTKEQLIKKINGDVQDLAETIDDMLTLIQDCKQRLDKIALRPNPLSMTDILDILIQNEESSAKPGWQQRVKEIDVLKQRVSYETDGKSFRNRVEIMGIALSSNKDRRVVLARLAKHLPLELIAIPPRT